MYLRTIKHVGKKRIYQHLQIVESYRDPAKGNSPRIRVLYNLGAVEDIGDAQLARLGAAFLKMAGFAVEPALLDAKDYGHVYAVQAVWDKLGLPDALLRAGIAERARTDFCDLIKWMVVNRLCEPSSKLALLDWLEGIWAPEKTVISYHALLRAMDRLINVKEKAELNIAKKVIAKNEPVDMVFYDITSTYFEGDRSFLADDFRRYGYSRDHREDRRQIVIGMVVTRSGIPVCHHVFPGNTSDSTTVIKIVNDLKKRFNLRKFIFVGDRGMLSDENLEHIIQERQDFIVAHKVRGNDLAEEIIKRLSKAIDRGSEQEQFLEEQRKGVRFVLAYAPEIAQETRYGRQKRLEKADRWMEPVLGRLSNPSGRGKKPTPHGTYDRIRDYLRDHNLLRFYTVVLESGQVKVRKNRNILNWEDTIDGVLLLETTELSFPAENIVRHYKELAEIERGWRCLKSALELRPVYHWTERRIRAHVFLCVIALQVERWMRNKLYSIPLSVPKTMHSLRQIKMGEIRLGSSSMLMPTKLTAEHKEILKSLGIPDLVRQDGKISSM
jgi:transposase